MFFPCFAVYMAAKGLSDEQVGIVISVGCAPFLVTPMITSFLADTRIKGKTMLGWLVALSGIVMTGMYFAGTFWWILLSYLAFRILFAGVFPLIDGMHFGIQQMRHKAGAPPEGYHRIRMMGSLGYMLPSVGMFFLLRRGMDLSWTLIFSMATSFFTAVWVWLFGVDVPKSPSTGRDVPTIQAIKTLGSRDLRFFSLALFVVWLAVAAHSAFYPRYVTKYLHLDSSWVCVTSVLSVTVEIFWMMYYRWWEKWLGLKWILIVGLIAAIVRLGLLAGYQNIWVGVGTQILHGPWVLAMYVVPPVYINRKATDQFRHSIQGAYNVMISGVAVIVGTLLAGTLFQRLGPGWMFGVGVGLSVVALVIIGMTFPGRSGRASDKGVGKVADNRSAGEKISAA